MLFTTGVLYWYLTVFKVDQLSFQAIDFVPYTEVSLEQKNEVISHRLDKVNYTIEKFQNKKAMLLEEMATTNQSRLINRDLKVCEDALNKLYINKINIEFEMSRNIKKT